MIIILCDNTECVHNRRIKTPISTTSAVTHKVCSHPFPILVENMSTKQIECKTFSEDSISPNIVENTMNWPEKCKACGHMNSEICNTCFK
jgi:hypothetical protein